jgi:hypothetical protein
MLSRPPAGRRWPSRWRSPRASSRREAGALQRGRGDDRVDDGVPGRGDLQASSSYNRNSAFFRAEGDKGWISSIPPTATAGYEVTTSRGSPGPTRRFPSNPSKWMISPPASSPAGKPNLWLHGPGPHGDHRGDLQVGGRGRPACGGAAGLGVAPKRRSSPLGFVTHFRDSLMDNRSMVLSYSQDTPNQPMENLRGANGPQFADQGHGQG